jgi:hypothetical protein
MPSDPRCSDAGFAATCCLMIGCYILLHLTFFILGVIFYDTLNNRANTELLQTTWPRDIDQMAGMLTGSGTNPLFQLAEK